MKIFERFAKIAAVLGIILVINILLLPVFLIFGHPVSYGLVALNTRIFLWQEYPELDMGLDRIVYDFKHGGYTAYFSSSTSIDTYCRLVCDGWGQVRVDYADSATSKGHTLSRIDQNYKDAYTHAISNSDFSFEINIDFCNITVQYGNEISSINKDFGIRDDEVQKLELDGDYDFQEFARKHGRITMTVYDEEVTVERAAEILLELKAYFDENDIPFYAIELKIRSGREATEYVELIDFLYTDIYDEGLVERVTKSNGETHAHYDKLDAARKYR